MDALAGKKMAILGLARQGAALARFAVEAGASVVVSDLRSPTALATTLETLADLPADRIAYILGEHPPALLDGADLLAVSGGVPLDAPIVREAARRGIPLTNDSLEFMKRVPATVIGITGSAGKTTTTALTGLMIEASGRNTWVGGNIGRPLIADLGRISPDDLVVQELSSFQLEIWDGYSPQIAAVLNITPNHLDRHKTIECYSEAKSRILRYQDAAGIAVLCADDPGAVALRPLARGRLRLFSARREVADGAFVRDEAIWLSDATGRTRHLFPLSDIRLRGDHNVLNVLAAAALADSAGAPDEAIQKAIRGFTGVPHRLEVVQTLRGVQYVNDSIATAPERALAALDSFDEPIILLAGGRDKDMVWDEWARVVRRRAKHVILFGELAGALERRLDGYTNVTCAKDLTGAVAAAAARAVPGDVVLLSPGGTSYDSYLDFVERGEHFRRLVSELEVEDEHDDR